jgi:hypothetical protein
MIKDIAITLESLSAMTRSQLLSVWAEYYGTPLNFYAQKNFLVRCLAYRLQETVAGGISPSMRKQLHRLAERISVGDGLAFYAGTGIKPGTKLIREWQGENHEVIALDKVFIYRSKHYSSLSKIARVITGTRWSGPRFFDLTNHVVSTRSKRHRG